MREHVPASRHLLFWSIALLGAGLDLASKAAIFARLGLHGSRRLVGDVLELRTSYNPGALWGLGRDWQYSSLLFAVASLVAGLFICYYLFGRGAAADRLQTIALALIMAGAIGNCYDRLMLGRVRDFVHFHVDAIGFDWAIFNLADSLLVVGAIALMLLALRPEPATEPAPMAGLERTP
ncbi:MAG TPA: signal peptidase II [Isosphaeraceae bacterium]|jgi:signal peptidase II|nr:signal peptidase II [Isosphaeraceae bacterium]